MVKRGGAPYKTQLWYDEENVSGLPHIPQKEHASYIDEYLLNSSEDSWIKRKFDELHL